MIQHLYLRDLLSFEEVNLEFAPGLVVLTGPSGAGKSLLMQALLANLGIGSSEAKLCETELAKPASMESEDLLLEDPLVVRALRKDRTRFYLNDQQISRRRLGELFAPYLSYLSVRDRGGFESERLLAILDAAAAERDPEAAKLRGEYRRRYRIYRERREELERLREDEKRLAELIEFARFEIDKIASIDPREGEYEELLQIKQRLSRLDRIREAMERASAIFELEESVQEVFRLMEKEGEYFSEAMNRLRADFEDTEAMAEELAEVDVEEVLDRLEQLSNLIRRYGSIAEALEYRRAKEEELAGYEHIEEDRSELERFVREEAAALEELAGKISRHRHAAAKILEEKLAGILDRLKLPAVHFKLEQAELSEWGTDRADLSLQGSTTATLSGGEFNRLRLALMSVALPEDGEERGVVFLDEIDANVSGDESIAIAEMIGELAKKRQVFAISHQPHLSARADQHILVRKEGDRSVALSLEEPERLQELSRIVAGEGADEEVLAFVRKLRPDDKGPQKRKEHR